MSTWETVVKGVASNQGGAAVYAVHHPQCDECADHGNDTWCDIRNQSGVLRESSLNQNDLTVVHNRVNAGELLCDTQADTDNQDADEPLIGQDFLEAHGLFGDLFVFLRHELNFSNLSAGAVKWANGFPEPCEPHQFGYSVLPASVAIREREACRRRDRLLEQQRLRACSAIRLHGGPRRYR